MRKDERGVSPFELVVKRKRIMTIKKFLSLYVKLLLPLHFFHKTKNPVSVNIYRALFLYAQPDCLSTRDNLHREKDGKNL